MTSTEIKTIELIVNSEQAKKRLDDLNQAFQGKQRLMPFFNRQNNDDLILAVQAAGVTRGRNGFRKDKGGEKLTETEEDRLEQRTDGTDAFDTLFIGAEKFPQQERSDFFVGGVL